MQGFRPWTPGPDCLVSMASSTSYQLQDLGESLYFSVLQCQHLQMGAKHHQPQPPTWTLEALNELFHAKHLKQ